MRLFAELREGVHISWAAILANKLRASLTTLGIVIGIVTVTLMGTAIEGLNRAFLKSISAIGTDVLYIERFNWFTDSEESWIRQNKRRTITLTQVRALEKQATMVRAVAPFVETRRSVKFGSRSSSSVSIIGSTDQMVFTSSTAVGEGRFISPSESEGGRPVCVLGAQVATNLFPHETSLGQRVRIGQSSFEVVGVLEKQGNFLGAFSLDNQVIIPVKQFMSSFWSNPDFSVQVKVGNLADLEEAREEVRGIMRKIRQVAPGQPDDFAINQQDMFIKTFHRVAGTIATMGLFITGLSLFVGGIGIMNIMFVSVAERTREIGIRKAIGAKRRTILLQFLIEAASICLLGGLIGLAIAYPLTFVISRFLPATMSLTVLSIALAVSLLTGVVSGFFPAWRAAVMNPVDALRNE